jgi:hypothetical protein
MLETHRITATGKGRVSPLVRGRGLFRDFRTSDPGGLDLSGQRISLESGVHGLHWLFSGIATQKNASGEGVFNDLGVSLRGRHS